MIRSLSSLVVPSRSLRLLMFLDASGSPERGEERRKYISFTPRSEPKASAGGEGSGVGWEEVYGPFHDKQRNRR